MMSLSRSVVAGLTAAFIFSVSPSMAQDGAPPPTAKPAVKKPVAKTKPAAEKVGPGCEWLGKRIIQALLRDDIVAAGDFNNMYRAFSCTPAPLEKAFDCAAAFGAPETAVIARERIDSCWSDPASAAAKAAASTIRNLAAPVGKKPEAAKP